MSSAVDIIAQSIRTSGRQIGAGAAAEAIVAALAGAGIAIVPVEPTREMWAAGGTAAYPVERHHDALVGDIWPAMIEAGRVKL